MFPSIIKHYISVAVIIVITALNVIAVDTISYESNGYGGTEKEAVTDALKKVVLCCLSDYSAMHQDSLKRVLSKIDFTSLVKSYNVIKSSDSSDYDTTQVSLHAEMNIPAIIDLLENNRVTSSLQDRPRVFIDIKTNGSEHTNALEIFSRMIEDQLLRKKLVIYNVRATDTLIPGRRIFFDSNNTDSYYKAGADFAIIGSIETGDSYTALVYGATQKRISCCVNLQLIDCADAKVLSSFSQCQDWGSQSQTMACKRCFETIINNKKFTLIDSIETAWKNYQISLFTTSINLHGIAENKIDEIIINVSQLPSVISKISKIINKKESRINILCKGSMLEITQSLSGIKDIRVVISGKGLLHIYNSGTDVIYDKITDTSIVSDSAAYTNKLSVSRYTLPPIYPCAIEHYAAEPYGSITLSNNSQNTLKNVQLTLMINGLSIPQDTVINQIAAQKEAIIPVTAVIDQKAIQKIDHSTISRVFVNCSFRENNNTCTTNFYLPVTINGLNDFDWKKPEMISSFVTPSDQIVKSLSRLALSSVNRSIYSIPQNVTQAIAVYEYLRRAGIAYIKDISIKKNIDNIQFPYQTILLGTGDCDDTSILLASLLESIGIETSMLVSDNHMLIMFNTGVHSKNSHLISHDTANYIVYRNMIWLPVETTDFNEMSFTDAWKKGLDQFHDAKNYSFISIINTQQSWEKYPPANPVHEDIPTPNVNINDLHNTISDVVNKFIQNQNEQFVKVEKEYLSMSINNPNKYHYNRLGRLYAQEKVYDKALIHFIKAFESDTADPDVSVNLANICCLLGQYDSADHYYTLAAKNNPHAESYHFNRFLFYLKSNQESKSAETLQKFIEIAGIKKLDTYLGLSLISDLSSMNESNKGRSVSNDNYSISIQLIKNSIKKFGKTITTPRKRKLKPSILPVGEGNDLADLSNLFFFKELHN